MLQYTRVPSKRGYWFALLKQVSDTERGLLVVLLYMAFLGFRIQRMPFSRNWGWVPLLRLPLPFVCDSGLERALRTGIAHAELHYRQFSRSSMVSMTFCLVDDMPMLYPFFFRYPPPLSRTWSFSLSAVTSTVLWCTIDRAKPLSFCPSPIKSFTITIVSD